MVVGLISASGAAHRRVAELSWQRRLSIIEVGSKLLDSLSKRLIYSVGPEGFEAKTRDYEFLCIYVSTTK